MLNGIVRSPVSFFDATPSGVLISKFSNDIGILDNSLVHSLIDSFEGPASVIVVIVNICQVYPYFIPPATVMMIVIVLFFNYSREVIVQSRQADLKNKNPIYQFYGETVNGLVQIRASNRRASFITTFSQIINKSTKASISLEIASRGFSVYSAALSLAMMFTGMIIGVSQCNTISSGLFAMSVIFLFQCSDLLNWFLRQIAASESLMISYLRSSQIANLQPEKQLRTQYDSEVGLAEEVTAAREDRDVHTAWPEEPSMQFTNLSARYKPSLPLALDDLSFTIERNFKVGIVGRTGAGKSSLIQAIFRVIEPELGSKYAIGGHDALEMGLHSLRQHVSVIPQTPFLFKGTVQQNVDPFSTVSEELVWNALREAGLHDHVQSVLFRLLSCPRSCSPTSPTLRSPSQSARSSCSAWRGRSCGGTSSWCWTRPPRTWTWRPTTSSRRLSGSGSGTRRSSRSRTGSTPSPTTTRSSSCRRDASPKWARPTSSSSGRASSQKWSATPAKTPLSSPARPRPATRKSSINHDN